MGRKPKVEQQQIAERMYTEDQRSLTEISEAIGIPLQTLSRWKAKLHWDDKKRSAIKTPIVLARQLMGMLTEKVERLMQGKSKKSQVKCQKCGAEFEVESEERAEVTARDTDEIRKLVKSIREIGGDQDMLGSILISMNEFVDFMKPRDPALLNQMQEHLVEFGETMRRKYGR